MFCYDVCIVYISWYVEVSVHVCASALCARYSIESHVPVCDLACYVPFHVSGGGSRPLSSNSSDDELDCVDFS